jgi:hypothetical protein
MFHRQISLPFTISNDRFKPATEENYTAAWFLPTSTVSESRQSDNQSDDLCQCYLKLPYLGKHLLHV